MGSASRRGAGLRTSRLRYDRRTAVSGWFIPFGNLVLLRQIADDIRHASSPPRRTWASTCWNRPAPPLVLGGKQRPGSGPPART
ncbi:DUF4328 domain-containing protein [Streptomyces luteolus]|uniref:DUF4328 domain-containing protein n=1 Tax=Streptomyces luteolus TaxID=3043615 RepID=UPI0038CF941E